MPSRPISPLGKVPGLVEAVRRAFANALEFSGRAARAEFWLFALFWFLGTIVAIILWSVIFGPTVTPITTVGADGTPHEIGTRIQYHGGWLGTIFELICVLPGLAVGWRRMHDRNLSGWWLLVPPAVILIASIGVAAIVVGPSAFWSALTSGSGFQFRSSSPLLALSILLPSFASAIFVLVQLLRAGTPGPNRFGAPPYEVAS